jgi:transposase
VQPWREALRQSAQATVRYETRPGKQLQADFGELWVPIGGVQTKVHFCLLTLGYSRRQLIRVYRQQQQRHWLQALEEAFRFWGGIPEEVLVDNAKALITLNWSSPDFVDRSQSFTETIVGVAARHCS